MAGSGWLTLVQMSEATGRSEKTLRNQVASGKFPAPHRFRGRNAVNPVWRRQVADDPSPVLPPSRGKQRITREMHLTELLDEVRWWVWQHGTAVIPQHATGRTRASGRPFPLGVRVSALRNAHKQGRLTKTEAAEFEALPGWSWDHWDSEWRARFTEVAARYQTGSLTARDKSWLGNQRRRWDRLRPEWRALFDAYPGLLEGGRRSRVDDFIRAAEQWLAEHPGRSLYAMPYAATVVVEGEKVPVGRRATYYRRRYAGLEGRRSLSADDISKIEALPGWTWDMSPEHVAAQKRRTHVA